MLELSVGQGLANVRYEELVPTSSRKSKTDEQSKTRFHQHCAWQARRKACWF